MQPGSQEFPDLFGGLGGLRSAELTLIDVGQAVADLHGDVDPGLCCSRGQTFRVAEQQFCRAHLHQQRRQPGQ